MQLAMNPALAMQFKSRSQIARIVTEDWASRNLFCAACEAASITQSVANTRAVDFACDRCGVLYQLKGGKSWSDCVPDAGYEAMVTAIRSDKVPNLFVMQYSAQWRVVNLLLVPSFFFTEAAIQKRKPLGPLARRAGWIGCNINLAAIAPEGKIRVVANELAVNPAQVRQQYKKIERVAGLGMTVRGWALNVLRFIHQLARPQFSLADLYLFEDKLAAIYPNNRNIRPKIRQQLQVLRDIGLIEFLGRGTYSINTTA